MKSEDGDRQPSWFWTHPGRERKEKGPGDQGSRIILDAVDQTLERSVHGYERSMSESEFFLELNGDDEDVPDPRYHHFDGLLRVIVL